MKAPVLPPEADTIILGETDASTGASPAARADLVAVPRAIGDVLVQRYRLIELIGEGGMSCIYKASDSKQPDQPNVAVKIFTRPFDEHADSFASLEEQILKLSSLSHPNIVRIFDSGKDGATIFITMEYLEGASLYTKLHTDVPAQGPRTGIDPDNALRIIAAIADALDYAHGHDIVHGDLKPGNVILTGSGEVKVIDFGIASWIARPKTPLERREAAQTKPPSAVTPRYASPQLLARHKPEAADDVYALACVAYELLTGSHPFYDDTGMQSHRFPPPRRPGLTATQHAALVKGLQFERRNRTSTVRQFLYDFSAPPRRPAAISAMAFCIVLTVAALGWFYGRPLLHDASQRSATNHTLAPELVPSPVPPPVTPTTATSKSAAVIQDCPTCPVMAMLPGGRFRQGAAVDDATGSRYEKPRHDVVIDYPLAMSANDITVGDFREFVTATGRKMQGCDVYDGEWRHETTASWKDPGFAQTSLHPVTCVSWNDAVAYAQWLSAKSGRRYRLPSASEWEYAARAGSEAVRPWGDDGAAACANANVADQSAARTYPGWEVFACDDGYSNTSPVGSFKANSFGLYDMLGNVFQWTQDCWHDDYADATTDGSARMTGKCTEHELRGGSWFSTPPFVRASYRNHFTADYRTTSVGFRLVRDISP